MADSIDEDSIGRHYAEWFTTGVRGIGMRYVFSRRGLWLINTPYRRILGAARITADDRVLDLGCGIGNILIALAQRIPFKTPPAGVDVSQALIGLGETEVRRAGLERQIELRVALATTLPYSDASFDVVLTSHVIKHLDDRALARTFAEVWRVLAPGGRFLIWEFKKSRFSAPIFISARASGLPPAFKLRAEGELARALKQTGFRQVTRLRTGLFLMPPVPRVAMLAVR